MHPSFEINISKAQMVPFNNWQLISQIFYFSILLLGKVVVELAKSRHIETGVLLHPARTTLDDIKGN